MSPKYFLVTGYSDISIVTILIRNIPAKFYVNWVIIFADIG